MKGLFNFLLLYFSQVVINQPGWIWQSFMHLFIYGVPALKEHVIVSHKRWKRWTEKYIQYKQVQE